MLSKMTVPQLKEYAEERGIDLSGLSKKADIVNRIEQWESVQVVDAEVIEEEPQDLAVTFSPGIIKANFAALEAQADKIIAQYDNWQPNPDNPDDVKDCARERKYLNGLANQIDNKRKDIKREYTHPLTEFEQEANRIRDKLKATAAKLQEVENVADQARRDRREVELKEHYEAFAGALVEVLPFEKILDQKWLNKSEKPKKVEQELESKTLRVIQEWENLKALNLENLAEAEAHYFEHLDFSAAVAYAQKLAEDKRRIAALKEQVEQPVVEEPVSYEQPYSESYEPFNPMTMEQEHRAVRVERIERPEPVSEAEQLVQQIASILRSYPVGKLEKLYTALTSIPDRSDAPAEARVMVTEPATQKQIMAAGTLLGCIADVHGRFYENSKVSVVSKFDGVVLNG